MRVERGSGRVEGSGDSLSHLLDNQYASDPVSRRVFEAPSLRMVEGYRSLIESPKACGNIALSEIYPSSGLPCWSLFGRSSRISNGVTASCLSSDTMPGVT